MLKRKRMDSGSSKMKNFMLRRFFKKAWGSQREMVKIQEKSFKKQWEERKSKPSIIIGLNWLFSSHIVHGRGDIGGAG